MVQVLGQVHQTIVARYSAKSPKLDIYNQSIVVYDWESGQPLEQAPQNTSVIVFTPDPKWYPQTIAQAAGQAGYIAVVVDSPIVSYWDMLLINYWNYPLQDTPLLYEDTNDQIEWTNIDTITVNVDEYNYLRTTGFIVQVMILNVAYVVVIVWKIYLIFTRRQKVIRSPTDSGSLVIILETVDTIVIPLWVADPVGVLGILPYSFTYALLRVHLLLTLGTNYILWTAFVWVREQTSGTKQTTCKFVVRKIIHVLAFLFVLLSIVLIGLNAWKGNVGIVGPTLDIVLALVFHITVGVSFVRNKKTVLNMSKNSLAGAQSMSRAVILKRRRNEESARYLAQSAVFIFIQVVLMVTLGVLSTLDGPGWVYWYCLNLIGFFQCVVGLLQIKSVMAKNSRSRSLASAN